MEVSIEEIEEGQILSQPVINNYGQMLLPTGTEMTLRYINLLKTWNIDTVTILGEDETVPEEDVDFGDEVLRHAAGRLKGRLNWIPENEFEQELYNIGLKRACEIIGKAQKQ